MVTIATRNEHGHGATTTASRDGDGAHEEEDEQTPMIVINNDTTTSPDRDNNQPQHHQQQKHDGDTQHGDTAALNGKADGHPDAPTELSEASSNMVAALFTTISNLGSCIGPIVASKLISEFGFRGAALWSSLLLFAHGALILGLRAWGCLVPGHE